jgi:hypothetical protein
MPDSSAELALKLQGLSRELQQLHSHILEIQRQLEPGLAPLEWMDRLVKDPAWGWLRAISSLVVDIDHALTAEAELTEQEGAAVAAQVRGVLFGEGDQRNEEFLNRYRPLLQLSTSLASSHGEVKRLLGTIPRESENESDRLHARHLWAMRCRHHMSHSR